MGRRCKRGKSGGGNGGGGGGDIAPVAQDTEAETVAPIDPARREELRAKLRAKLQSGGNASKQDAAKQLMEDPASALLRMGIDDPKILQAAPGMVKSIASRVRSGKAVTGEQGMRETLSDVCDVISRGEGRPLTAVDDSDDEEAPPPE